MFQEEKKMELSPRDVPVSSVSLWLETDEWNDLRDELMTASERSSNDVMAATFLAKNGRQPEYGVPCGLAAVFLD